MIGAGWFETKKHIRAARCHRCASTEEGRSREEAWWQGHAQRDGDIPKRTTPCMTNGMAEHVFKPQPDGTNHGTKSCLDETDCGDPASRPSSKACDSRAGAVTHLRIVIACQE